MPYQQTLSEIFDRCRDRWVAHLATRFPQLPLAVVEDAISDVFLHALEGRAAFLDAFAAEGPEALEALLRTAVWRATNTCRRTGARRRELLGAEVDAPVSHLDPERIVIARDHGQRLIARIPSAARRFGGRDHVALGRALRDRCAGLNDTDCAQRHAVRREAINRARRWLCDQPVLREGRRRPGGQGSMVDQLQTALT